MLLASGLKEQIMLLTLIKLQIPTGFFIKEIFDGAETLNRNIILHFIYVVGILAFSIVFTVAWLPLIYKTAFAAPFTSYMFSLPLDIMLLWLTLWPDEVLVRAILKNFIFQIFVYGISALQIVAIFIGFEENFMDPVNLIKRGGDNLTYQHVSRFV